MPLICSVLPLSRHFYIGHTLQAQIQEFEKGGGAHTLRPKADERAKPRWGGGLPPRKFEFCMRLDAFSHHLGSIFSVSLMQKQTKKNRWSKKSLVKKIVGQKKSLVIESEGRGVRRVPPTRIRACTG